MSLKNLSFQTVIIYLSLTKMKKILTIEVVLTS